MADVSRSIELIFGVNAGNFGQELDSLTGQIDQFAGRVTNVTQPLANVTTSLFKTEAAIIALAAAYGGFALTKAAEFQTAQNDLAKVLDAGDPSLDSFTKGVLKLSEAYGVSATNVVQGIANFKQAGFTAKEAALLQKDALDLIIAGDIEAATASNLLVAALKGFGAEASEASRFTEALNNVSNKYATNVEQLTLGVARLSPVAKQMGFSFEEATGLLTPVIEVFRSGPEAANALRTGLLKLIDDSKPVGDALAKLGVSQKDANGELRSGKDILFDVGKAFKTTSEKQKLQITTMLVGTEQAAKMVQVFDNLAGVQEITAVAMERTNSVSKEVGIVLASSASKANQAKESFNNLGIAVGSKLAPAFDDAVGGSQSLITAFRKLTTDGGLDPLFNAVQAQGADLGKLFEEIAIALPDAFANVKFDDLIAQFGGLRDSVSNLFGDIDLTSTEGLTQVIQGLIDFISTLTEITSGAVDGLKPLIDGIVEFAKSTTEGGSGTKEFIGNVLGIATAINTIVPIIATLGTALLTVGTGFAALGGVAAIRAIGGLASSFGLLTPITAAAGAAIASVGFAANANIDAFTALEKSENDLILTQEHTVKINAERVAKLKEISEVTGVVVQTEGQLNKAISDGLIVLSDTELGYSKATEAISEMDQKLIDSVASNEHLQSINKRLDDSLGDVTSGLKSVSKGAELTAQQTEDLGANSKALNEEFGLLVKSQDDLTASNNPLVQSAKDAAKALIETGKSVDVLSEREKIAIENTQELEITLLELTSNQNIKKLEFETDLKVEQIKADAKAIEAAFTSTADVFKSASDAFASIFAAGPNDGDVFGFDFERSLREAGDRADKALDNTINLTDAQVKYLEARTKAVLKGDAKVSIVADGLAPELQAVLTGLLDSIQIQANAEGLELLI